MGKPTTLTAQVARGVVEQQKAEKAEDAKFQNAPAPDGKIWVRLIRPCYDSSGVLHPVGVAALFADEVPSSAKRISVADAPAADGEDD